MEKKNHSLKYSVQAGDYFWVLCHTIAIDTSNALAQKSQKQSILCSWWPSLLHRLWYSCSISIGSQNDWGWKTTLSSSGPTIEPTLENHHCTTCLCTTSTRLGKPSKDEDSTTALGSLVRAWQFFQERNCFSCPSVNLPWCNLKLFPLVLSFATWEKTDLHLTPTALQGAVESNEISFQPHFLQAEEPRFPRLLLTSPLALEPPPVLFSFLNTLCCCSDTWYSPSVGIRMDMVIFPILNYQKMLTMFYSSQKQQL